MTGDEGHYHLDQMKITKHVAQATNGWIAVEVQTNGEDPNLFPSKSAGMKAITPVADDVEEIRISKETADGIFKALPRNGHLPVLQNAMVGADGEDSVIAVTDLDSSRIFRAHGPSGNFPDLDAVRPKQEPVAAFFMDAYLLNELLKVIRDFKGIKRQESCLLFEVYENDLKKGNLPISVHAKNETGQKLRALVMPMHGENADDFRFLSEKQIEAQQKAAKEAEETAALEEAKRQHEQQQEAEKEEEPEDALQELADKYPGPTSLPGVE
ncbi:MAG: hypothetical protein E2P05_02270 [Acidobacteria bacterium]|nr:MAG: hypothetical protein E2P05_02270 [Acidobacteriota bacterium]